MAAPAANLQQNHPCKLKCLFDPSVGDGRDTGMAILRRQMPLRPQQPVGHPALLRIVVFSFIIFVGFIVIIITLSFIIITQRQSLQRIYSKSSPPGCFDRTGEALDHRRDGCRSPRVIWPLSRADLRVKASDSPASNAAAARVASLREPGRRPDRLPDWPFSNGRPRTRPGSLGKSLSDMVIPLVQPAVHLQRRGRQMECYIGNLMIASIANRGGEV